MSTFAAVVAVWRQPGQAGAIVQNLRAMPPHLTAAAKMLDKLGDLIESGGYEDVASHGTFVAGSVSLGPTDEVAVVEFDENNDIRIGLPCAMPTPIVLWDAAAFLKASAGYAYTQAIMTRAQTNAQEQHLIAQVRNNPTGRIVLPGAR